jgi:signal peptidase I
LENLENGEISKKLTIRKYAERIVIGLVLAVVIPTFVAQAYKIPSGSMEPTLEIGDYILVSKYIYGIRIPFTSMRILDFKRPQLGDVIVSEG